MDTSVEDGWRGVYQTSAAEELAAWVEHALLALGSR